MEQHSAEYMSKAAWDISDHLWAERVMPEIREAIIAMANRMGRGGAGHVKVTVEVDPHPLEGRWTYKG